MLAAARLQVADAEVVAQEVARVVKLVRDQAEGRLAAIVPAPPLDVTFGSCLPRRSASLHASTWTVLCLP